MKAKPLYDNVYEYGSPAAIAVSALTMISDLPPVVKVGAVLVTALTLGVLKYMSNKTDG